jgi:CheY-like chemotaxis protein
MDIKKRLFIIPELVVASRLGRMDAQQLEEYVKKLNEFVDFFPENEKKTRAALEKKDIDAIAEHMKSFGRILADIYAEDLSEECLKYAGNIKNLTFERVNAYIIYLLSTLIALSIDIQMAINEDENIRSVIITESAPSVNEIKIILAVDDDAFSLDMLKNAITGVSCNLICATNGGTALNILRTHTPDLFILDIDMPGMDGIELAGKMRSLGYNAPLIFITGNADKNYVIRAINAGGSDFIVKPINPQNVKDRIKKFL